jgi:hypothetical protein
MTLQEVLASDSIEQLKAVSDNPYQDPLASLLASLRLQILYRDQRIAKIEQDVFYLEAHLEAAEAEVIEYEMRVGSGETADIGSTAANGAASRRP